MKKIVISLGILLCGYVSPAHAQSNPGFIFGQVPSAANWNGYFSAKQDFLGNAVGTAHQVVTGFAAGVPQFGQLSTNDISGFPFTTSGTVTQSGGALQINPTTAGGGSPSVIFGGEGLYRTFQMTVNGNDPLVAEAVEHLTMNGLNGSGSNQAAYKAVGIWQMEVAPGSGPGFGGNIVCDIAPQSAAQRTTAQCNGFEIDINNADANRTGDVYHSANRTVGILLNGSGLFTNNEAIEIAGGGGTFPMWDYGIRFSEAAGNTISSVAKSAIIDDTGSYSSLDLGTRTHTIGVNGNNATYSSWQQLWPNWRVDPVGNQYSASLTIGFDIARPVSTDIFIGDNSNPNGSAFLDQGTHTNGLTMNGKYTNSGLLLFPASGSTGNAATWPNGGIALNGVVTGLAFTAPLTTPASSAAACNPGIVNWDANYVYVCTSTNTWKRSALATF